MLSRCRIDANRKLSRTGERVVEIANGKESDGISYRAHLDAPDWVITVTHPDGRVLTERFHWTFEPRCGPDVADMAQAENIMERLITALRTNEVLK